MEILLSIVIFLPLVAAGLLFVVNQSDVKPYVVVVSLIELVLSLMLWVFFDDISVQVGDFRFVTLIPVIEAFGISYHVGIDAISLFLVILSAFITFLSVIFLSGVKRQNQFFAALLMMEGIVIGVFSSLDVMLFYLFWELSLVPMLYIIGVWGSERKIYAAIKFFLYTFSASLVMLFGILYFAYFFYEASGVWSFNLLDWYLLRPNIEVQKWLFVAFFIGIAVKIPMFPFHTWLPYAHGQAPTIGSVILASILLKMGSYAFIRFSLPLFPDASVAFVMPIAVLCVIMIIYTSMIAFVQDDMKQVIAYSSIAHMGVVVLGTFSLSTEGIVGSVFLMISHGIVSGALFMIVGILYSQTHTKLIKDYGGIATLVPKMTALFALFAMANIGLPLTIGFVGEFLSLFGFFKVDFVITLLAGSSIIFGAVYMLNLFRKVFLGEVNPRFNQDVKLRDISVNEGIPLVALAIIVVWLGIYPKPILSKLDVSVKNIIGFMVEKSLQNSSKEFLLK